MGRAVALALWLALGFTASASAQTPAPSPTPTASSAAPADPRQRSIIEEYERVEAQTRAENASREESPGFGAAFFQMVMVLAGVVALAYLILAKLLPKVMRIEAPIAPRRLLTVIDRLPLDQRRSIMVLKMAGQYFLIGAGDGGIELLSRLDAAEVERALASGEPTSRPPLLDALWKKKPPKEGAPS
ncbi:MAG: FliO/MopB family protein [Deltaproteobacteria bacterium]|nr:FliO/MopB family protein [Deltaproteobacteria bacterium]